MADSKEIGMTSYGFQMFADSIVRALAAIPEHYTIVDAGQGDGVVRGILQSKFPKRRFVGIEPPGMRPRYGYKIQLEYVSVKMLLQKESKLRNNCVVLVCWPYSSGMGGTEFPEDAYDFEVVRKLRPVCVVSICTSYESISGSENFRNFANNLRNLDEFERTDCPLKGKYCMIKDSKREYDDGFGMSDVHLSVIVQRRKIHKIADFEIIPCKEPFVVRGSSWLSLF